MSKRNATTAAGKPPRPTDPTPTAYDARWVLVKLKPEPPPSDDLAAYLESPDGEGTEFWQAVAMATVRRSIGRPLSVATYARLRAALIEAASDAGPRRQATA
jgi:hypothetical protein